MMTEDFGVSFLLGDSRADVGLLFGGVVLFEDGPLGTYDAAGGHGVCV